MHERIYLSPPHMGKAEKRFVEEAFATNWIAPVGPHLEAFEEEFCEVTGAKHAVALSSGTAALHLALILAGVGEGDEVLCSTLTFAASANPILYLGAKPVFIDSEASSWNLDPNLVAETLRKRAAGNKLPKAIVVVHLYGQCADMKPILEICNRYDVTVIEDAAEALGATYDDRHAGTMGAMGVYSFNGNKIITTSGGGMLVAPERTLVDKARYLSTQARDPAPHYQHSTVGYNYRLSNVLAGIGRGQLKSLEDFIEARRRNFEYYENQLSELPGVAFMPEAPHDRCTRWLTCLTVDERVAGVFPETIRQSMEEANIECRPVWKPLHLQPVFQGYEAVGGSVSEELFKRGLCLPSGSALTNRQLKRVVGTFQSNFE